jgi:hypothetical protein
MAECIGYIHESDVAAATDGSGDGRLAVLVTAPAEAIAGLGARLDAAGIGSPGEDAAGAPGLERLGGLASAGIRCHAVVVHPAAADSDTGRPDGPAIARIVHGALYEAVAGGQREVEIRTGADAVDALAAGLERHAAERHGSDLFRPTPRVGPADADADAAPMRLAGLLAQRLGALLREAAAPHPDAGGPAPAALGALLRAGWLTLEEWPPAPGRHPPDRTADGDPSDAAIRRLAVESAWRFIAGTPFPRDEDGRIQRIVLAHLLSTALHGDGGYASSDELLERLAARGYENLKDHYLKSAVIAGLRDSGVLVTSSGQGYKIPQSQRDVMDFVHLVDGQVIPLLERLARMRRMLDPAGEGTRWPVADARHAKLRRVLDALEDAAAPSDAPADGAASGDRPGAARS